jgi:Molecular chaperone (small heat shock protein)
MSRRYPFDSLWRDFDDMLTDMEHRFTTMMERLEPEKSLSIPRFPGRLVPALRGEISVDIREQEDAVIVVADLPGVQKEDIQVSLVDPRTLEILSKREKEAEGGSEGGYYVRERLYGSMRRRVTLPARTTDAGAHASFKNGVLEVRLPKQGLTTEKQIPIGE